MIGLLVRDPLPDQCPFKLMVYRCVACHTDHEVEFKRLQSAPMESVNGDVYPYWGVCPVVGDPIFMRDLDEDMPQEAHA
jgi:hypothetical protein